MVQHLLQEKYGGDPVVQRLNDEQRGLLLGEFRGEDKILTVYKGGYYRLTGFELSMKFDDDLLLIEKWHPTHALSCVYWVGKKEMFYVKRFLLDVSPKKVFFVPEEDGNEMKVVSSQYKPKLKLIYNKHLKATKHLPDKEEDLSKLIDVKGIKAQGNQLSKLKIKDIELITSEGDEEWPIEDSEVGSKDFANGQGDTGLIEKEIGVELPETKSAGDNVEKQVESRENVVGSTNTEKSVVVEFEVDTKNTSKVSPKGEGEVTNPDSEDDSQPTLF